MPSETRARANKSKSKLLAALRALRLDVDATESDARFAYKSLARAHHPDKGGDGETFRFIAQAYELVMDKFARDKIARETMGRARETRVAVADDGRADGEGRVPTAEDDDDRGEADDFVPLEIRQGEDSKTIAPSGDLKRLGDDARASGEFERAIECYNAAAAYAKIDGVVEYAELYHARGLAYAALERWNDALDDAERALGVRALWAPPCALKGRALEATRAWSAAAAWYRRSVDVFYDGISNDISSARELREGLKRVEEVLLTECRLADIDAHRGGVLAMAMKPSGRGSGDEADRDPTKHTNAYVCTIGAEDKTLKIFSMPSGTCEFATKLKSAARDVRWAPDGGGALVAVGADGFVKLWLFEFAETDAPSARLVRERELQGFEQNVDCTCATFDATSEFIAVGASDGSICVWDARLGTLDRAIPAGLNAHKRAIACLAFHPVRNRAQLTSGSLDGDARVWDLVAEATEVAGECLHTLRWDAGAVVGVDYTPCGRLIVTTTSTSAGKATYVSTNRLLVWSSVTGRLCKWYDAHSSRIRGISWHPHPGSRNVVVSACDDGVLRVWSVRAAPSGIGKPLLEHDADVGSMMEASGVDRRASGGALAVAHSPMGGLIAVVTRDGRLRVHDSETLECAHEWRASASGRATCVSWAPTPIPLGANEPMSRTSPWIIVTGGDDGRVCAWRIARGDDDDDDGDLSDDDGVGEARVEASSGDDAVARLRKRAPFAESSAFSPADVKTWWDANENEREVAPFIDEKHDFGCYLGPSPNDKPIHIALDSSPTSAPAASLTSKRVDLTLHSADVASIECFSEIEREIERRQGERLAFMRDSSRSSLDKRAYAARFAADIEPLRSQRARVYNALKLAGTRM